MSIHHFPAAWRFFSSIIDSETYSPPAPSKQCLLLLGFFLSLSPREEKTEEKKTHFPIEALTISPLRLIQTSDDGTRIRGLRSVPRTPKLAKFNKYIRGDVFSGCTWQAGKRTAWFASLVVTCSGKFCFFFHFPYLFLYFFFSFRWAVYKGCEGKNEKKRSE